MTATDTTITGKRVLVVEDDYFVAKRLVQDLRSEGAEVVGPAPSVADALRLVEAEPLDAAVLDVNLRGEMAFAVADALAEQGVHFVFATGYDADAVSSRYASVPHFEKPVEARMLVPVLFPPSDREPDA